ncbi:MAG: hypothetical protein IPO93_12590 [Actinobacteria bacterium]|nr:hypothetical protein [Actinomycetota bacterium]
MSIHLAEQEARALEGFCRRQLRWDERLPARIVTTSTALGMFTAPPLGVLVFVAVPGTMSDDTEPVDVTVSLSQWADMLRDASQVELTPELLAPATPAVTAGASVGHLPPRDGWQVPMAALSGDLVPLVEQATVEFEARSAGLSPRAQETIADDIWDKPVWAGLPLRTLHAARQLGMLTNDQSRVSAATSGAWKRLSTTRGQVFVKASGPAARLALHVVR